MFKDSLPSISIIGGLALIVAIFTGSQHTISWSSTTTVAQVVKEFNFNKQCKAHVWGVPAEALPEISEGEVLGFISRLYVASDESSKLHQTLETAVGTRRVPECTHIKVSKTNVAGGQGGVQLELRFGSSQSNLWYLGDETLPGFTVPLEL